MVQELPPFEVAVERHASDVLRICRALVGSIDAGDVWSETFISAMRSYPELDPASNLGGWLAVIAHNKAIDHLRSRGRISHREIPMSDVVTNSPERATTAEQTTELLDEPLRSAILSLPEKQRAAVVCHHLGGIPHAAVGEMLGISATAARRNAADGIANLRKTFVRGDGR